jgi:hypothetical protein
MRIDGKWLVCDDANVRPVFEGLVRARDNSHVRVLFLADTGADATVFSADIWLALDLPPAKDSIRIEGLGGLASSEMVKTDIKLKTQSGIPLTFKGQFAADHGSGGPRHERPGPRHHQSLRTYRGPAAGCRLPDRAGSPVRVSGGVSSKSCSGSLTTKTRRSQRKHATETLFLLCVLGVFVVSFSVAINCRKPQRPPPTPSPP